MKCTLTERTVMGVMGWSSTAMAAKYQHVIDAVKRDVASQVDGLLSELSRRNQEEAQEGIEEEAARYRGRGIRSLNAHGRR